MSRSDTSTSYVPVRLVCLAPPPAEYEGQAASFGLQDKAQRLHEGARQADGSLLFSFDLPAKLGPQGKLDFAGPFVHGKPAERFLYLSWRGITGSWIKRLKIPLASITAAQIAQTIAQSGGLTATVVGSGAARTEPLGDGWTVYAA